MSGPTPRLPVVIPVGFGIGRWRFTVTGDSEEMVFTTGLEMNPATPVDTLATELANAFTGAFPQNVWSPAYTFRGTTVTQAVTGGMRFGQHDVIVAGTALSSANPPNNCALLVTKVTGFSSRKLRGRFYLPPAFLDEGAVSNTGVIDPTSVTSIQGHLTTLFTTISAGPDFLGPRILHTDSTTPTPVLSFRLENQIATQRRRMRR